MAINDPSYTAPKGAPTPTVSDLSGRNIYEEDNGDLTMYHDEQDEPSEVSSTGVEDSQEFYRNLVPELSDEVLERISMQVKDAFLADKTSRAQWDNTITQGLSLLGLEIEELNEPYEGACSAHHPLIIEAAVNFQSKASPELLPPQGPVKTQIMGTQTEEKETKAERIKNFMNYQIMNKMPEYIEDTEKMLFWLPIIGTGIKKTYYSGTQGRPKSEFIPIDQFYAPFSASSVESAPRLSHLIFKDEEDLLRDIVAGVYSPYDSDEEMTPSMPEYSDMRKKMDMILGMSPTNSDQAYTLIEQHTSLDMEGTQFEDPNGLCLPYIVTIDYGCGKVLSIRRNWREEDESKQKRLWFTHYPFVPGLGLFGVGFIHLLGNLEMTLTAVLRSLVDSGQFANMQGGFKLKGMRIVGDNEAISPGEFKDVECAIQDLSKAILPLQYKEPSNVLFQMLQYMDNAGQKFADKAEQVIQDSTNYGPVGTTMALLEAGAKFFTAIHKRCHFAQKKELRLLYEINSETLPEEYPYDVPGASRTILKSDFDGSVDVIPVSDPNVPSKAHRLTMLQTGLQMGAQYPQYVDNKALVRKYFMTMGLDDVDTIVKPDFQAVPQDPLSDIQSVMNGQPIQAFPGQNHDAHVQVKAAFLQDPANGASPFMQQIVPMLLANIREHMLLKYQEQIGGFVQQAQQQSGQQLPEQAVEMVMAEAAQQIMQANIAAAQQPTNPELMVAQAEMIKAQAAADKVKVEAQDKMVKNSLKARDQTLQQTKIIADIQKNSDNNRVQIQKEQLKQGATMVNNALDQQKKIADLKKDVQKAKKPVATPPKT